MSKRSAALTALVGLLAVAGYQNRDKIGAFVKDLTGTDPAAKANEAIAAVKNSLGDGPVGSTISKGLTDLVDAFGASGQGDKAKSWVSTGDNQQVSGDQVAQALGEDTLGNLMKQTGLTRDDLLSRLAKVLPEAVDKLTPDGKIPAA